MGVSPFTGVHGLLPLPGVFKLVLEGVILLGAGVYNDSLDPLGVVESMATPDYQIKFLLQNITTLFTICDHTKIHILMKHTEHKHKSCTLYDVKVNLINQY